MQLQTYDMKSYLYEEWHNINLIPTCVHIIKFNRHDSRNKTWKHVNKVKRHLVYQQKSKYNWLTGSVEGFVSLILTTHFLRGFIWLPWENLLLVLHNVNSKQNIQSTAGHLYIFNGGYCVRREATDQEVVGLARQACRDFL